jgi:hypothetical protein
MFLPLARLFRNLDEASAQLQGSFQQPPPPPTAAPTESTVSTGPDVDGDVTMALAPTSSPKEKADLVLKLNKDAEKQRADSLRAAINKQAATIIRNRVVALPSAESIKAYMEGGQRGLVARTIVIDVTMPASRQSGPQSRIVSLAPTAADQKAWAASIKVIPATPIVGHVLIRSAQHSVEVLNSELTSTHAHKRSITVPIQVPQEYLRYIRGGVAKSLGPRDDDATGVDFVLRTIGKRSGKPSAESEGAEADAKEVARDEAGSGEDDEEGAESDLELFESESTGSMGLVGAAEQVADPSLMSATQLKAAFGSHATEVAGVLFQHSARCPAQTRQLRTGTEQRSAASWRSCVLAGVATSWRPRRPRCPCCQARITAPASFLRKTDALHVRLSERSHSKRYRKGQLDPTVWVRALRSSLSSSNAALAQNEALVIITGGTPEAIVAGVICGFKRIFVAVDAAEATMMQMPSAESAESVDYNQCPRAWGLRGVRSHCQSGCLPRQPLQPTKHRYASPDPECPSKGVLAAAAVRMLAPFIANAIHRTPGAEQAGSPNSCS